MACAPRSASDAVHGASCRLARRGPAGRWQGWVADGAAVPLLASPELLEDAGITAVRAKSVALTEFALELVDEWLTPHDVQVISPRNPDSRGGHVTIRRPGFREVVDLLWVRGVLPDYREPDAIRLGPAPLTTSFAEVHDGLAVLRDLLALGG